MLSSYRMPVLSHDVLYLSVLTEDFAMTKIKCERNEQVVMLRTL